MPARAPNAVDLWRGFALITIFVDHVPGLTYARYTFGNVSIADAADLFVFLAGRSLRLMSQGRGQPRPLSQGTLRLLGRALELYAAQVLITLLAIALLAASAIELENPLLLQMSTWRWSGCNSRRRCCATSTMSRSSIWCGRPALKRTSS